MRPITSITDLIELTKTDVRYKWLIIAGYITGNRYSMAESDILKISYEDALNWTLNWVKNNVSPTNRIKERTCKGMIAHINSEIVNIVDRDDQLRRTEYSGEPLSKNKTPLVKNAP